jgi:hypothetical protein
MTVTNLLAYCDTELITAVKRSIFKTPELSTEILDFRHNLSQVKIYKLV